MHTFSKRLLGVVACLVTLAPWHAGASERAEFYGALYWGATLAQPLRDVSGIGALSSVTFSDIHMSRGGVVGAKLGVFMPGPDHWMGVETEVFFSTPHIKQQDLTLTAPGVSTTTNFVGARTRVASWAVNWLVRYPGERVQPYIGIGPGLYYGRISGEELGTGSDRSLGLNALGGVRFLLTSHLGLFVEYKYNRVAFDFGGTAAISTLYELHHGVVGLSLHF